MRIYCSKRRDQSDVFENAKVMKALNEIEIGCQSELGEELVVNYMCKSRNGRGAYLALTMKSTPSKNSSYNTFCYSTDDKRPGDVVFKCRNNGLWLLGGAASLTEELKNMPQYRETILKEVREFGNVELG